MSKEQVNTLNQIMAAIDQKAADYKEKRTKLREAQAFAEKKLILDLVQDALKVAKAISPTPTEAIEDLYRLHDQLADMR